MDLEILDIDSPLAALALRAVVETWGMPVHLTHIGNTRQLVERLQQPVVIPRYLLLECHGIVDGLALPELAPELERLQPYHRALTPANVREFVQVPGATVINTGCSLGTEAFALAFIQGGARTYIGADSDPSGDGALLYVLRLFYGLQCQGLAFDEAHAQVRLQVPDTLMFHLWEA